MSKTVTVESIIRKLYVTHDGQLIEVKEIDNPEDYAKSVTVYSKEAVKGATKGKMLYAVAVADFVPKKRASASAVVDNMLADIAAGMTADEIAAKYKK